MNKDDSNMTQTDNVDNSNNDDDDTNDNDMLMILMPCYDDTSN